MAFSWRVLRLAARNFLPVLTVCVAGLFLLTSILFLGCSDDGTGPPPPNDPSGSGWISSEGGTVSDKNGNSVLIPPGALAQSTFIEISAFQIIEAIPDSLWSSVMGVHGVVDFGPDGTEFALPVTITLASLSALNPGDQAPLFMWDVETSSWQQTEFMATANADGRTYSAEVTHFTSYTVNMPLGPDGVFGDFDLEGNNGVPSLAFSQWQGVFRFRVRDLGHKLPVGDCCMEVTGLLFRLNLEVDGTVFPPLTNELGDITQFEQREIFQEVSGAQGAGNYQMLQAIVYWSICDPGMGVVASPGTLDLQSGHTKSDITATVRCGNKPMVNTQVSFQVGGPGEVNPSSTTTRPDGRAYSTFIATEEGTITVRADVLTCQDIGEPHPSFGTTEIVVRDEDSFYLTIQMTFIHETGIWDYASMVHMYLPLTIDEQGNVTTTGAEGSHSGITVEPTGANYSILDLTAPGFLVNASGTVTDGVLDIQIAPADLFVYFIYHRDTDPVVSIPISAYSNMEASIMASCLNFSIPLVAGEFVSGSGSELFEDEPPAIDYTFHVTVGGE